MPFHSTVQRQTSRKSCLRWRAHKSRQRYLCMRYIWGRASAGLGGGGHMFTHMLECLFRCVCVSLTLCIYLSHSHSVRVLMSFVFLEQTLIVFDFSKDSSDARLHHDDEDAAR